MLKNATSKDAMKLRKTGFEFSPSFVIRLVPYSGDSRQKQDGARHRTTKIVSVFHKNLMSFPINFGVAKFRCQEKGTAVPCLLL